MQKVFLLQNMPSWDRYFILVVAEWMEFQLAI